MIARKGSTKCICAKERAQLIVADTNVMTFREDISMELSSLRLLTSSTEPGYLVSSIGMLQPPPRFSGQVVVVTGGAGGIGGRPSCYLEEQQPLKQWCTLTKIGVEVQVQGKTQNYKKKNS